MDRNGYQQARTGKCGNVGDDGGHLIASSLGGAGDQDQYSAAGIQAEPR